MIEVFVCSVLGSFSAETTSGKGTETASDARGSTAKDHTEGQWSW
jgi:hypothetical protein